MAMLKVRQPDLTSRPDALMEKNVQAAWLSLPAIFRRRRCRSQFLASVPARPPRRGRRPTPTCPMFMACRRRGSGQALTGYVVVTKS